MLDKLSAEARLQLINLICSFAWIDFEIGDEERDHIRSLCAQLAFGETELAQVEEWLKSPPGTDSLADPGRVPREHRDAFLRECRRVIMIDGYIDAEESLAYRLFREILMDSKEESET